LEVELSLRRILRKKQGERKGVLFLTEVFWGGKLGTKKTKNLNGRVRAITGFDLGGIILVAEEPETRGEPKKGRIFGTVI